MATKMKNIDPKKVHFFTPEMVFIQKKIMVPRRNQTLDPVTLTIKQNKKRNQLYSYFGRHAWSKDHPKYFFWWFIPELWKGFRSISIKINSRSDSFPSIRISGVDFDYGWKKFHGNKDSAWQKYLAFQSFKWPWHWVTWVPNQIRSVWLNSSCTHSSLRKESPAELMLLTFVWDKTASGIARSKTENGLYSWSAPHGTRQRGVKPLCCSSVLTVPEAICPILAQARRLSATLCFIESWHWHFYWDLALAVRV